MENENYIKLTKWKSYNPELYIDVNCIIAVENRGGGTTQIYTNVGKEFIVEEDCDSIIQKMAKSTKC